jgi:hypothetical protein
MALCSVVDQSHVDADPDPDPTFHFGAEPDPDPDPTLSFTHVGTKSIFFLFTAVPVNIVLRYLSCQRHRCHKFYTLDSVRYSSILKFSGEN